MSLYGAIALLQAAQRIGGGEGERIGSAAERFFDDQCGNVPRELLVWILLHRPPPPPPPWLQQILGAIDTLHLSKVTQGALQEGLAKAAQQGIKAGLESLIAG